jgi:hypothetical protein
MWLSQEWVRFPSHTPAVVSGPEILWGGCAVVSRDRRVRSSSGPPMFPTRMQRLILPGEACSMGASCTCNAAAAGSIPVLSTCDGRQSDRGAARSPGMREGSVRLRVTARRRGTPPVDRSIRCRPMAGRWPLAPVIEVRILAPEPMGRGPRLARWIGLGSSKPDGGVRSPGELRLRATPSRSHWSGAVFLTRRLRVRVPPKAPSTQ